MRCVTADRLILEPQRSCHADEMFVVLSDPAIYAYENQPPVSVEWLCDRFTRLESRQSPDGEEQWLNWVIRRHEQGLIGFVQASVVSHETAEIGYVLSSAYWGQGLAREAIEAMMSELKTQYRIRQFRAVLSIRNERSLRLLKRLGFRQSPIKQPDPGLDPFHELLMQYFVV